MPLLTGCGKRTSKRKRADRDVNEGVAVALLNDDATSGIILAFRL